MKFITLECVDFKSFAKKQFTFGDDVRVSGENFKGKTSIPEAIAVCLYGSTLGGSPQTDHLVRKGAKKFEVTVIADIGGTEHEFIRSKAARKTQLYLDGKEVTQADFDKLLPSKEHFLTVFVPGFFTDKPEREGREMLMNLITPPKQEEVLAQLDKSDRERLEGLELRNPDELAKEKRAEIKEHGADILRIEGRIEVMQERISREIPQLVKFDSTELEELRKQASEADNSVHKGILQLQSRSKQLGNEYQMLKRQIKDVPQAPYHDGDNCPVCQRALEGEALESALSFHTREVEAINVKNAEIVEKCKWLVAEGHEINANIQELSSKPATDNSEIEKKIKELEAKQREVEMHNGNVERLVEERVDAQAEIGKLREQIEDLQSRQTRLEEVIRSIGEYRAKLASMQVEQLSKHLNRVSIQLFDITKTTGEIKPAFHVLYDEKPFKSLSYSERIRANLEFSTLFNKVLGYDIPVYIDNAESITHFDRPLASQLFRAEVVVGKELTVESDVKEKGEVA